MWFLLNVRWLFNSLQPRLKCLIHIVKQLSAEHCDFIAALLPEVCPPSSWRGHRSVTACMFECAQ